MQSLCDLSHLEINQPCAFLDILIPPIKIIDHGHTYAASQHAENGMPIMAPLQQHQPLYIR